MDRQAERTAILNFRNDAIRDGWEHKPVYKNEPEESACKLKRDGFIITLITRAEPMIYSSIDAWGPDGLSIEIKLPYDPLQITSAVKVCDFCGLSYDETFRVAFANRSCKYCLPAAKAKLETAGWCS